MKGMEALEMEEAESFIDRGGHRASAATKQKSSSSSCRNLLYFVAVLAVIVGMHYVTNSLKEDKDDSALSPSSGGTSTTSGTTGDSPFQSDSASGGEEKKNIKYSEISKIIPDPEHLPIDEATREALTEKYGKWHFWDGEEEERPEKDYCAAYPNRDVPGEDFPDESWQVDAVFVNHLINDGEKLVTRAMEAIFEEYGHGKPLPPEGLAERMKMFRWEKIDLATATEVPEHYSKLGTQGGGGWTTERSFQGLVRRLLHALNTNDDFVVVMGGHSNAAGHGNHFRQSYMMQFHKIMAPVFARLGVKLVTKNMAQGGLGTIHNALGAGSIYGDSIDILIWDSGMTEREAAQQDLYIRQGLLGGRKVPLIWMAAGAGNFAVARDLHNNADVDIGMFGNGMDGIPETKNDVQAKSLPWAARYLSCSNEGIELCKEKENKYCAKCWIPRNDVDPEALGFKLSGSFPSQVSWHMGWRRHQLTGRVLAFSVLEALQEAIQIWSDGTMGGPPLDDSYWHVTDYYENIRTKVKNLNPSVGACSNIVGLPARVCSTAMKARTLHTPRANPTETSITSLLRPSPDGYIPKNEAKMLYEGPDVHNSCFDVPKGDIDVLAIVSGRRRLSSASNSSELILNEWIESPSLLEEESYTDTTAVASSGRRLDTIVPGKGWQVIEERPGLCDGEYNSICGRSREDTCPMSGHHDHRGSLAGNEYSGWVVMDIPDVIEGIIVLKLFTWLPQEKNTRTKGWSSVDNKGRRLGEVTEEQRKVSRQFDSIGDSLQERRRLGDDKKQNLPETFQFDYAINGKITTLSKAQFLEAITDVQRVFEAITLLDEPGFSGGPNVEVAFRMRGCARQCTFGLSHVYWA